MQDRIDIAAPSANGNDDGGSLNIWQILYRRRRVLMICLPACWLVGVAYWMNTPATYESSAEILVMRKNPRLAAAGFLEEGPEEPRISKEFLATQMRIIQSQRIVSSAVRKHRLDELPSIREMAEDADEATGYLMSRIDVSGGGQGPAKAAHVLNVAFRHTCAADANLILEAIYSEYQDFLASKVQDVNQEVAELIRRAREDLERELEAMEKALLQARREAPMLWSGEEGTNIHRARFEMMEAELSTIRIKISQLRARLDALKEASAGLETTDASEAEYLALIDEESATRVAALVSICLGNADRTAFQASQPIRSAQAHTEYSQLLTRLAEEETLLERFGPNHPEVVKIRKHIDTIRAYLDSQGVPDRVGEHEYVIDPKELLGAYVKLLEQDLAVLLRRERELEAASDAEQLAAKELIDYELRDATIRKQIARRQELFDALVERLRAIDLAKQYDGYVNELLVPAQAREVGVGLLLSLVLASFMGLALSAGAALVLEYCDPAFRDLDEVRGTMRLPIVSQVLDVRAHKAHGRPHYRGGRITSEVPAFHSPLGQEVEAFRSLRTRLFHMARGQDGSQRKPLVIACSSPNEGDGKTMLTANLAVSIAQAGQRVLVIDCDMRKPRLHSLFGLERTPGLSNALAEGSDPRAMVLATDQRNLWVLPAGEGTENPAELLESPQFGELLNACRERYDFVLLDTPPVLTASDPCIVAWRADGVLLTVRLSKARRHDCIRAQEMLAGVGARVIGICANGWNAPTRFMEGKHAHAFRRGYRYASTE